MIDIFGTLGPACSDATILRDMFIEGMTGVRINLSHTMLKDCEEIIENVRQAAGSAGVTPKILVDLQGPELRIGELPKDLFLDGGESAIFINSDFLSVSEGVIPVANCIMSAMDIGKEILLDDGKILVKVEKCDEFTVKAVVIRGGILRSRKSILIRDVNVEMPVLTDADEKNIKDAVRLGVTGIMQPFVRSGEDVRALRYFLDNEKGYNLRIYAKIENMQGVDMLEDIINECDEIIIARGDLGNAVPLWQLPQLQKDIAKSCKDNKKSFMVVTQMLASMETNPVPTRAEVSDIFNAVLDGASSVMVTGETAVGNYPVNVIKYLKKTADAAEVYKEKNTQTIKKIY